VLSAISHQQDLWAQLAAMRAAQSPAVSSQTGTSAAAMMTGTATGSGASTIASGTSPLLSDDLMAQFLSFGGVEANTAQPPPSSMTAPGGAPSGMPTVATAAPAGPGDGVGNLFADLTSLISHLSDASAAANANDGATTTAATTAATGTDNTPIAGNAGTATTGDLGAALLQDLQSIASDVSGSGTAVANGDWGTVGSNGTIVMPPQGGFPSWDPSVPGIGSATATTNGTSTSSTAASGSTALTQTQNDTLTQQIAQAVAAYMQSISGQTNSLGSVLSGIAV
jgi:hypothetical protein